MKANQQHDNSNEAGITLIETLVALSILSLISIFLFQGLRTASALWQRHEERSDLTSQVVMTQDLLRHLIERTYPGMPAVTDGTATVLFSGAADKMEFMTFLPERISPGGLHKAVLSFADETVQLAWSATGADPFLPITPVGGQDRQTDLLVKVPKFEISYFGQRDNETAAAWHDSWSRQRKLPALVRVRATLAGGDRAVWPEQVIAPRIDVDAKCVYDPLTYGCRGR